MCSPKNAQNRSTFDGFEALSPNERIDKRPVDHFMPFSWKPRDGQANTYTVNESSPYDDG